MAFRDLTNEEFYYLTVISRNKERKTEDWGGVYWICLCKCGKTVHASSYQLNKGEVKSCGCRRRELSFKERGRSGLNRLVATYRSSAKKRRLNYDLNEEQFVEITKKNCTYCGIPPARISTSVGRPTTSQKTKEHGAYLYNGIDRIDSSKGYVYDNCVPCCWQCNIAKSDKSVDEFKAWVRRVSEYLLNHE